VAAPRSSENNEAGKYFTSNKNKMSHAAESTAGYRDSV
jgi:hypothetical protein